MKASTTRLGEFKFYPCRSHVPPASYFSFQNVSSYDILVHNVKYMSHVLFETFFVVICARKRSWFYAA